MIQNLVEQHVIAGYERLRPRFPDFCGCETCRGDVLVYALNRLPARYVASREGTVVTELNLETNQTRATIEVMLMEGIRKVSLAPRCGRRKGAQPT
ncbi:MAG TPA: late competence development ComFB family protein [Gemmatimonadales bacterium]|nr:late competence development ComFB family protein [Gemmatimonadales bacterium]